MRNEILRMDRVDCYEQGILYLHDFNLQICSGEIMGLLAINRSGLLSLLRLLSENIPIQRGFLYYREQLINSWHGAAGQPGRICVIQGNSFLVPGMTVADNIFVLRSGFKSWLVRSSLIRSQLLPEFKALGLDISPDSLVEKLSSFQQIAVELLKAVMGGCRLVVLREISTFVGAKDMPKVRALIRHFAKKGIAFLYISYLYEELEEICDQIAIMVDGTVPKILRRGQRPTQYLQSLEPSVQPRGEAPTDREEVGQPVFEMEHVYGGFVKNLSFSVAAGECVVLQDLSNLIFRDLIALLNGELLMEQGLCRLCGDRIDLQYSRHIACIAEQPSVSMIFPELSAMDNLCFTLDHRLQNVWRSRKLRRGLEMEFSRILPSELLLSPAKQLTTAQKYDVVYGRIRLQHPKVVFCVRPFQGADLDLRRQIHSHLEKLQKQGCAIVILDSNLTDPLFLPHRVIRTESAAQKTRASD